MCSRVKLKVEDDKGVTWWRPRGIWQNIQISNRCIPWLTMYKKIVKYMDRCRICQVSKGITTKISLYMSLSIPNQPWTHVNMDIVLGLLWTQRRMIQSLWWWFSTIAHFIGRKKTTNVVNVALLYFREVHSLHGLPQSIVSNRESCFLSHFNSVLAFI